MEQNNILTPELIDTMIRDKQVRVAITKESFLYFFHFYFAHYVTYATADFQREIMFLLENENFKNVFIVAFRGSGKSSIVTTAYPIWAILGKQQKKFALILCQTMAQARKHMRNLRGELEKNELLKDDLGPFQEEGDEWGLHSLVFASGARIMVASTEQSIRGMRHNEHRPDILLCDDVEDMASTKTREGRDKTYQWLTGEVIPAGDRDTRLIIVGNLLHEDSLLMRFKQKVQEETMEGVFKEYPLVNEKSEILWPGKFATATDVEEEHKKSGNEIAWQREYLLRIVADEGQIVKPEDITYYDYEYHKSALTEQNGHFVSIGLDPAISQKTSADFTAMVLGRVLYGTDDDPNRGKIFVLPNPIHDHIDFFTTLQHAKSIVGTFERSYSFFVESTAYQLALVQELMRHGIRTESMRAFGDKRVRLNLVANYIKTGRVVFPPTGCERLLEELIHFGVEKHDDLVDALAYMILGIVQMELLDLNNFRIGFIDW